MKEVKVTEPVDLSKFEGKEVTIELAEPTWVDSKFHESGKAKCLKVESEVVTTIKIDDKEVDIRASELLNLKQDADGSWGYSSSPQSNLNKFMKRHGVSHPSKLVGKKAKIKLRTKTTDEGQDLHFLGFIY